MSRISLDSAAYVADLMAIDTTGLPPDGGPRFNRLIFARSPYLLQHAENPVDWYEWGPAAFDAARAEQRPMLLSIGYATCHWCHVMAHESFQDEELAALLNRHFICIKVDREERPDIDAFYMTVAQTLTGGGGWPLNIFMTPDKRPFMAITYLPKRAYGGMSGLMELLANITTIWRQQPDMIERNCQAIMTALTDQPRSAADITLPDLKALTRAALQQLQRLYDPQYGGFGSAPKFPMPIYLSWLISQRPAETGAATLPDQHGALQMALHTLRQMRTGGIWDQLGGGLHRYSVDQEWLAPHFEKMLYDQAMLALVALEAFQVSGEPFYSDLAADIFSFVERELQAPEGAFCAALDADSEGVEGKFYLWDTHEIEACLGADAELFCRFYDVTAGGNFEGHTILTARQGLDEFCRQAGLDSLQTGRQLQRSRDVLLRRRAERIRPLRDAKIITAWNGLMIAALAKGGLLCGRPEYSAAAARAAGFILAQLRRPDGRLLRCYLKGASAVPAFLEDYAFLGLGLLELYEVTLEPTWLNEAAVLADGLLRHFRDPDSGEFVLTGSDAEQMPTRVACDHDGVTPAALASTAGLLLRLGWTLDRPELIAAARAALAGCRADLQHNPLGQLGALQTLQQLEQEPLIATLYGTLGTPDALELVQTLKTAARVPLVVRFQHSAAPAAVALCIEHTCFPPLSNGRQLSEFLLQKGLSHAATH